MNGRVVMRKDVPGDIHSIVSFLEQHSLLTADRFVDAVFPAMQDLALMPGKGSLKQFHSRQLAGVRSWSVPGFRNFLILYRPIEDGIDVLAVTHGARRLRALLLGRVV